MTAIKKQINIQHIPISQLKISEYNVRKHAVDVTELTKSIEEQGILQPLLVRPESNGKMQYGIVIGSRRFAAAKEAKLKEVPATIYDIDPDDAITISLVENLQRSDLEPKETAQALVELIQSGLSVTDIASKIGKRHEYISEMAGILDLLLILENHGIKTQKYPKQKDKKDGKAIPVQHAIYISAGIRQVKKKHKKDVPEDKQVELAKKTAPISQENTEQVMQLFQKNPDDDVDTIIQDVLMAEESEGGGGSGRRSSGKERTELTKMGDVRDGCRNLCKALTDREFMPHKHDDVLVDYIKPTREYRQFIHGLSEDNRDGLHDWLSYTVLACNDMLQMIEEIK
jgi:ParB/RepB/Spo0J family partition protein